MIGVFVGMPTHVAASHSLPSTLEWWDLDNDGIHAEPGEGNRPYQRVGTSWTTAKIDRVTEAASAWRTATSWNPTITTSTQVATMRVDGVAPCGSFQPNDVGLTCLAWTLKQDHFGEYYFDIYDTDIGINLVGNTFHDGSGPPPASKFDLRGVITHELGHGISLDDLYGSDCGPNPTDPYTMCGSGGPGVTTYNQRSLTSDDINAANFVY